VVDFSGCPGDGPNAKAPNWVTCPWPPDFLDVLNWQWDEVVTPYWKEHGKLAADHGVKIAIEMHPGFVVYNPETLLRLRAIAGPAVGAKSRSQPSFLARHRPHCGDPCAGRRHPLRSCQGYPALCRQHAAYGGTGHQTLYKERDRSWIFRTVGYGHSAEWWSEFISTLRMYGYDYVLSIEHEDSLMSPDEGLTKAAALLSQVIINDKPAAAWWV